MRLSSQPKLQLKYDGTITIATGKSRKDTNWKNRELLWSQLLERLSQTTRTRETYDEYKKLPKSQQDNIKDVGGFVGGSLKGGRRKADTIAWRQLIALDADYVQGDLWGMIEMLWDFACAVYSTHKHSPQAPRLRLVIPLSRPVTADEYPAVARKLASELNIDFFDDSTYEPHRLMYWPSTSVDGEYVFKYQDGPWLNPDNILAVYPDWRNPSYWPESSRVQAERRKLADKQGDPWTKDGIIGAFCRTYSIEDAIEKVLSDIYTPCGKDRYTYIPGSTSGGLVVYDEGRFAYSHHSTDPISGRLVNTFDLVRIHKFGHLDDDSESDTPTIHLPSYKAMQDFCLKDELVRQTLGAEKLAAAKGEFQEQDNSWMKQLEFTKKGELKPNLNNLTLILRNDPNLRGIAYNAHRGMIALLGAVPWRKPEDWKGPEWCDDDDANLRTYMEQVYNLWSPGKLDDALVVVSHERAFHPIRDYLNNLQEWDGIPRVEELLIDYLGADDTPYVRAVTRKTLVAAVARVMNLGCKFDYMLVLNGPQGIGKSTLFLKLGGEWFTDNLNMTDMKDKTAAEKLQGYWIIEIGELAGIKKAEIEAVKSFLSRQRDVYRPAYGRRTVEHPRQCIIVGSTNSETGFLRDTTGNRRFWPVQVKGKSPGPWVLREYEINQIWAEAVELWKAGEELYLAGELAKHAELQQQLAMEADGRLGMIKEFLDIPLPEDWDKRNITERRLYIHNCLDGTLDEVSGRQRQRVCIAEIWCELFKRDLTDLTRYNAEEIHGLMKQIEGWRRYDGNADGKLRFPIYGMQRAYIRTKHDH